MLHKLAATHQPPIFVISGSAPLESGGSITLRSVDWNSVWANLPQFLSPAEQSAVHQAVLPLGGLPEKPTYLSIRDNQASGYFPNRMCINSDQMSILESALQTVATTLSQWTGRELVHVPSGTTPNPDNTIYVEVSPSPPPTSGNTYQELGVYTHCSNYGLGVIGLDAAALSNPKLSTIIAHETSHHWMNHLPDAYPSIENPVLGVTLAEAKPIDIYAARTGATQKTQCGTESCDLFQNFRFEREKNGACGGDYKPYDTIQNRLECARVALIPVVPVAVTEFLRGFFDAYLKDRSPILKKSVNVLLDAALVSSIGLLFGPESAIPIAGYMGGKLVLEGLYNVEKIKELVTNYAPHLLQKMTKAILESRILTGLFSMLYSAVNAPTPLIGLANATMGMCVSYMANSTGAGTMQMFSTIAAYCKRSEHPYTPVAAGPEEIELQEVVSEVPPVRPRSATPDAQDTAPLLGFSDLVSVVIGNESPRPMIARTAL